MANNAQNTGKPLNEQIWGEGGSGHEGYKAQIEKEIANRANAGTATNSYTNEELQNAINLANQNGANITGSIDTYSQTGSYVKDGGSGVLPGTGEEGWSLQEGIDRPVAAGASGADERFLSDGAYAYVQYAKQMYANAKDDSERAYWHNEAEKTRARAGYSGGTDGSMYVPLGQLGVDRKPASTSGSFWRPAGGELTDTGTTPNGTGTTPNAPGTTSNGQSDLNALLEAWKEAALNQSDGKVDYAVAKAVADLERALADAQPMFKEQAETVAREERQALDNSALYAEMRGDKGGIGQEQYNSIQNTAAQNHLAVQQAQTKLATDTQRQIADLRAQGEFEKADAALQITQQYLQQLVSLEQWAREYNLSVEQFQASLKQWEAEYNLAMQQFETSKQQWAAEFGFQQQQYQNSLNQWAAEFDAAQNQWQQEFDFAQDQYKNSLDQWEREFAAEQMLAQMKLANSGGGGNPKLGISDIDLGAAYQYLYDNNLTNRSSTDAIVAMLGIQGIPSDVAKQVAALYVENGYAGLKNAGPSDGTIVNQTPYSANDAMWDRGANAPTQVTVPDSKPYYQSAGRLNLPVYGFDLPPLVEMLRQYGAIEEGADGYLRWKNGWNASNYSSRLSQIAGEAIWDRHS